MASVGLSLRAHRVSFLSEDLRQRRIVSCGSAMALRDGKRVEAAGLVLVRQRPGSEDAVCFITLEDETGIANLVIWPDIFEKHCSIILSESMIAAEERIQREGDVMHLVTLELTDLSGLLCQGGARGGEDDRAAPDHDRPNFRTRHFH